MVDLFFSLLADEHFHSQVLQVLLGASVVVPVLEKLAGLTATKLDDRIVGALADFLHKLLAFLPRVTVRK